MRETVTLLWAVHISDNVLSTPWWAGGLAVAALLACVGAWRLRDEEIPQVALLTAAFFVASSFHVRLGPGSVHLLLNGLVGVVLGPRAFLAIPIGLLLQYLLVQHGGFYALGVNACVMSVPAVLAWGLFRLLHRLRWMRRRWFQSSLVVVCTLGWVLSLVFSLTLLLTNSFRQVRALDTSWAEFLTFHPWTLAGAGLLAAAAVYAERKLEGSPEFALGLLLGEGTVLATVALNCLALLCGGETDWLTPALVLVVAHLPVAVLEGVIVGFMVSFLARVKPDLLGLAPVPLPLTVERDPHATAIVADPPHRAVAGPAGDPGHFAPGTGTPARR